MMQNVMQSTHAPKFSKHCASLKWPCGLKKLEQLWSCNFLTKIKNKKIKSSASFFFVCFFLSFSNSQKFIHNLILPFLISSYSPEFEPIWVALLFFSLTQAGHVTSQHKTTKTTLSWVPEKRNVFYLLGSFLHCLHCPNHGNVEDLNDQWYNHR